MCNTENNPVVNNNINNSGKEIDLTKKYNWTHKSHGLSKNIHWTFSQNTVKLLKITQKPKCIVVSIIRYNYIDGKDAVSVWNLPFKLSTFRHYILKADLYEQELTDTDLISFLFSVKQHHEKFTYLIGRRIDKVVDTINKEQNSKENKIEPVVGLVREGSSFDSKDKLNDKNIDCYNTFIKELLDNLKLAS